MQMVLMRQMGIIDSRPSIIIDDSVLGMSLLESLMQVVADGTLSRLIVHIGNHLEVSLHRCRCFCTHSGEPLGHGSIAVLVRYITHNVNATVPLWFSHWYIAALNMS